MDSIELHQEINKISYLFEKLGFWHQGDEATPREMRIKFAYSFYCLLFPISLIVGAIGSENTDEMILTFETAILTAVTTIQIWYVIWKKKEILEFLHKICVYSISNKVVFEKVNDKLNRFMKIMKVFMYITFYFGGSATVVLPFIRSERKLFLNLGLPFDYKNNEIAFWIALAFMFTETMMAVLSTLFTIIMWYLLLNCCLRYKVLGDELTNLDGETTVEGTKHRKGISDSIYMKKLTEGIKSHRYIYEYYLWIGSKLMKPKYFFVLGQ